MSWSRDLSLHMASPSSTKIDVAEEVALWSRIHTDRHLFAEDRMSSRSLRIVCSTDGLLVLDHTSSYVVNILCLRCLARGIRQEGPCILSLLNHHVEKLS